MGRLSLEARVGFFILAALGVSIAFVLALGDFSFSPGHRIYADYAYTGSLQVGAPVRVSGVQLGRVAKLQLLGPQDDPPAAEPLDRRGQSKPPVVRATLSLDRKSAGFATQGAVFSVGMHGLIGEAYVEITPGPGTPPLPEGTAVRGVDAPRLDVMAGQLSAMLDSLGKLVGAGGSSGGALAKLLDTVNALFEGRTEPLGEALDHLAASAGDLRAVMGQLQAWTADGGKVDALVRDAGTAVHTAKSHLPALLERADATLKVLQKVSEEADEVVEPEQLKVLLADVQKAASNFEKLGQDARSIVQTIRRGEGSIGGFVQDPQLYDDAKELLRDLKRNPWKVLWRE